MVRIANSQRARQIGKLRIHLPPAPSGGKLQNRLGSALILCLALVCTRVLGGSPHVRSWHVEDGLPDGSVTALAQTPDGYLWVGTRKGLVRFDGARFSRAGSDRKDGLLDQRVRGLLAAHDGSLWIISERGALTQFFNGKYEPRFLSGPMAQSISTARQAGRAAQENPPDDLVAWNDANLLTQDKAGRLWAVADNATLLCFDERGHHRPVVTNGLPGGVFRGVSAGATGEVWRSANRFAASRKPIGKPS